MSLKRRGTDPACMDLLTRAKITFVLSLLFVGFVVMGLLNESSKLLSSMLGHTALR